MVNDRNPGLDFFRSLAISLVLLSHTRHLFTWETIDGWNWWWLSFGGFLGVELFFVLSGFLIGIILIDTFNRSSNLMTSIKVFLLRRWFRTLPLYFFILFITIITTYLFESSFSFPYLHFIFLQNYSDDGLAFFPVAWSLSVEEWFYLLLSLLSALVFRWRRNPDTFMVILGFWILLTLAVRFWLAYSDPSLTWDNDIRKNIFLRFDSLLLGVLLSAIRLYSPCFFKRIASPAIALSSLLLLILIIYWYLSLGQAGLNESVLAKTLLFFCMSMVLLPLLSWLSLSFHYRSYWIESTARYSYAVYLIHLPIVMVAVKYAQTIQNIGFSLLALLFVLILTFGIAALLYRWIERPFMELRERIAPSSLINPNRI
ncbi:acyltransferase [Sulfuricurvum sp.]|uniref:acyltransferase family protein n=1 Tax=Sulfuricurvum sp. TaxID=2025608 RepID=UPI00261B11F9|nr:acyltransferase [Sulfuricurvum sp.]MDD4883469.1 acyltransferase [Sulfuricurvum sp.]